MNLALVALFVLTVTPPGWFVVLVTLHLCGLIR